MFWTAHAGRVSLHDDGGDADLGLRAGALHEAPRRAADVRVHDDRRRDVAHDGRLIQRVGPLDLGDDLGSATPEEIMQKMEAMLEQREREEMAAAQAREERRASRKKSPRQRAAEVKLESERIELSQSIRAVYRKLASALHPDREPDEAERLRKTSLMSEVNAAYDRKNLSELLKLQLHIAQIDSTALSRMADDKLNAMCLLLTEQVEALEEDEAQAQFEIRHYLGVNELDHISAESLARALAIQLRDKEHEVDTLERDLRRIQNEAELKRWLKEQAQLAKEARAELTDLDRLLYR